MHCVLIVVVLCLLSISEHVASQSHSSLDETHNHAGSSKGGRIVQSLFRFHASQLGSEFEDLLKVWYNDWLHTPSNETLLSLHSITPDASGKQHASHAVSARTATLFRRQCYGPLSQTQKTLYRNLEQRRKEIEFQYIQDANEEMKLLHTMVKRFSPAFHVRDGESASSSTSSRHIHKKKQTSTVNTIYSLPPSVVEGYNSPSKLVFQTEGNNTQQWTWRPAGHFSSRGTQKNYEFRVNFFNEMRQRLKEVDLDMGRQSGMFWYPPGSVREWHSNYLDLVGSTNKQRNDNSKDKEIFSSQEWRMYFVRTVRDNEFDARLKSKVPHVDITLDGDVNDHSAMHIIPGEDEGITARVLQDANARLLKPHEKNKQFSDIFAEDDMIPEERPSIASGDNSSEGSFDRNAVWRIPDQDGYVTLFRLPKLWHCIVSEEVHRYSLGFAFSDREVRALLRLADVKFDVESPTENGEHDEL